MELETISRAQTAWAFKIKLSPTITLGTCNNLWQALLNRGYEVMPDVLVLEDKQSDEFCFITFAPSLTFATLKKVADSLKADIFQDSLSIDYMVRGK